MNNRNGEGQKMDKRFPSRRLPEDLVNPNGVYSGIARRNAYEDGEFFPRAAPGDVKDKRKQVKD